MYKEDKSQLKSVIWSNFVHFNLLSQKPEQHSDDFMNIFKSILKPIDSQIFEERPVHFKQHSLKKELK